MNAVDTLIAPPELDAPPHGEEADVDITIWITEADGTRREASLVIPEPSVDELADALVTCLRAVSTLRGPLLLDLIEARLR